MKNIELVDLSIKADEIKARVDMISKYVDEVLYTKNIDESMASYSLLKHGGLNAISNNLTNISRDIEKLSTEMGNQVDWDDPIKDGEKND